MSKEQIEEKYKEISEAMEFQLIVAGAPHSSGIYIKSEYGYILMSLLKEKIEKQSGWISVDERLPENGTERVAVFLQDDPITATIGINKIDTDRYLDGKWVRWGKYVTHWMPLPTPPMMKGGDADA